MSKKIKLRFLINTMSGGGAEKVLVNLLNKLNPERYEVSLVTITQGTNSLRIPEHVSYRKIIPFSNSKITTLLQKIIYKMPPKIFATLFLSGEKDIEIAYLEGTPTRFVAAKSSKRKLAFVHCDFSKNSVVVPYYKNVENCLKEYGGFSKVCFVSEASKTGFELAVGKLENSCVVHNVLDYENISKLSLEVPKVNYTTKGLKLITVGRLVKEKGYDRLLRIVSRLEKDYDFELLIVGEGVERENLQHLISEKGIQSAKLVGFHENPYSIMKMADLFVCSSFTEGYSTVVSEAVFLGLPIITTKCAGMEEILDDGKCGIIVENDEESLYLSLKKVFECVDDLKALKQVAVAQNKLFTTRNASKEYGELFETLLSQNIDNI